MRFKFTKFIMIALAALVIMTSYSCKRSKAKTIAVDTQFAVALFSDDISIKEVLGMMDSTTNNWLKVRNDSIFAYYADSVKGVLKASDLLGNIEDQTFSTRTTFSMPVFAPSNKFDQTVVIDKFMKVPFQFDGFVIDTVLMRKGVFDFTVNIDPQLPSLKSIEVFSNQMLSAEGEPLVIAVDNRKSGNSVNLANFKVMPEDDTVSFGARLTLNFDSGVFPSGDYNCEMTGGLTNVGFKTVYATVTKNLDSIFNDHADIDFGINGLSGAAYLPVPKIMLTYRNTFGLSASSDVTTLEFYSSKTGLVTDLLAADHWIETVGPTNGEYRSKRIGNFVDNIDVLAGYTRLDFDGSVGLTMPGDKISISDTSSIDVVADIEIPFSFTINDLCYADTVNINFEGNGINVDMLDSLDFYLDFNNKIPLEIDVQALFMKDDVVIDSLFDEDHVIPYNSNPNDHGYSTIECTVTDEKLYNVLQANRMILRLGASTDGEVWILESNSIFLRMKMMTYSSEIDIDNVMNY